MHRGLPDPRSEPTGFLLSDRETRRHSRPRLCAGDAQDRNALPSIEDLPDPIQSSRFSRELQSAAPRKNVGPPDDRGRGGSLDGAVPSPSPRRESSTGSLVWRGPWCIDWRWLRHTWDTGSRETKSPAATTGHGTLTYHMVAAGLEPATPTM